MRLFVTAIGTGCGKTVVSAILCEALQADYWKPVQSGTEEIDAETVQSLLGHSPITLHPERYKLKMPASPHQAAKAEGIEININDFELPATQRPLVIEGAGGVLVPLNEKGDFVVDLAAKFGCEIVLVSNTYLGSINHTLLTVNELKRRGLRIKGIVFNGETNPETEQIILQLTQLPCLLRVQKEDGAINNATIKRYATLLHF